MLLGPATVESLEGGVLTVAFPKEGEAKGFASSGCDQVLATTIGTLLGLNVRVRAVVGTGTPGPGPRTQPRSAPQAPAPQAPVPQAPAPSATGPDAAQGGPEPAAEDPSSSTGPANQATPPSVPARGNPGNKASSRRGAADPGPAAPEEWPDDAGPAGDAAPVTGMELIERQLGGRVIEEIEES